MKKDGYAVEHDFTNENGMMVFKGKVDGPVIASFGVKPVNVATAVASASRTMRTPADFVLTNSVITISGEVDKLGQAKIDGGKFNTEYRIEKANLAKLADAERAKAKALAAKGDSTALRRLDVPNAALLMNEPFRLLYIETYPNALLSMLYLYTLSGAMDLNALKTLYSKMGDTHKDGLYAGIVKEKMTVMERTAAGKQAVEIDKVDLQGNAVNLASLKGKYVLVDFWGSWCHPCRASHPHLKALYSKYKSSGFEILGIAHETKPTLEAAKEAWKKAIKEDGMDWIQVLNNEGIEKSDAVKAYAVSVYPTKILLDKEGKVIGRYIGESKEIDDALNKVFGF
ncbi:MAG: AhpC/TSA family protein [Pedobacter sp.]|nr:MAG: AhpC/TSA family protein [Pedobacter sp.]